MNFPFYQGEGKQQFRDRPAELPIPQRSQLLKPNAYLADPGLRNACNVALLLGQPLLLTGEPGSGKTQFAYSFAWEMGFSEPLKFETKSTSLATDLFYTYDALKRFQDAQTGNRVAQSPLPYLTYQALGRAILRTRPRAEVEHLLPPDWNDAELQRSIVLIDEVDKAPRDFPNDILNELEQLYFRIPELGNVSIEANPALQPIVILTSNSEKDLPDAFLRRCIFYHIPFPEGDRLREIVANRLGISSDRYQAFVQDALDLFARLRGSNLRKKPATAELLGWILALRQIASGVDNPITQPDLVFKTLGVLVKTTEDQKYATELVNQWLTDRTRS